MNDMKHECDTCVTHDVKDLPAPALSWGMRLFFVVAWLLTTITLASVVLQVKRHFAPKPFAPYAILCDTNGVFAVADKDGRLDPLSLRRRLDSRAAAEAWARWSRDYDAGLDYEGLRKAQMTTNQWSVAHE